MEYEHNQAVVAGEYVGQRRACDIAGRAPAWLLRQALLGRIKVQLIPGIPPRYRVADVEAMAGAAV